jgi:hypothetical protein
MPRKNFTEPDERDVQTSIEVLANMARELVTRDHGRVSPKQRDLLVTVYLRRALAEVQGE